jgi:hypothetical protein
MKRHSFYSHSQSDLERLKRDTRREWIAEMVARALICGACVLTLAILTRMHWPEAWIWLEAQVTGLMERGGL